MTKSAIVATGLRKSYGEKVVLDGIDLDIPEGTIFALLGPNGAGKTTTVQILSTYISTDAGEVRIAGHDVARDPDAVRAVIGVTGQFSAVDKLLTGEENLILMAELHHLSRAEGRARAADLLKRFDLVDAGSKVLSTYSGGMQRRRDLAAAGVTIFLTTQYLDEADQLADSVAVLDRGKLVAEGTPDELKRRIPGGHIRLQFTDATVLANAARIFGEVSRDDDALTLQISTDGGVRSLRALLDQLEKENIEVDALTVHTPDLDDVYFALTGHPVTKKETTS